VSSLLLLDNGGTHDINGIRSSEGEEVEFTRIKVRNAGVETWMKNIETNMK